MALLNGLKFGLPLFDEKLGFDDQQGLDFDRLRNDLLNALLITYCVVILPALILSIARGAYIGSSPLFVAQPALVGVLYLLTFFRKKIPYYWRLGIYMSLIWISTILSQIVLGPLADARAAMIMNVLAGTLFLPTAIRWLVTLLPVLIVSALAIATLEGGLTYNMDYDNYIHQPLSWLNTLYVYSALTALTSAIVVRMIGALRYGLETARIRETQLNEAQALAGLGSWEYQAAEDCFICSREALRLFNAGDDRRVERSRLQHCIHPLDIEEVETACREALESGSLDIEHRLLIRQEVRWVHQRARLVFDSSGRLLRAVGTTQDITGKKLAEHALKASESRFQAIFDGANAGIAFSDPTGTILLVNDCFRRLTGYPSGQLASLNMDEFTHPDDRAREAVYLAGLLRGDSPGFRMEKRYIRSDGNLTWVDLVVTPQQDEEGRVTNLISVAVDITERKQGDEALALYTNLIDYTADAIYIAEPSQDYRIIFANDAACQHFGLPQDQLLTSRISDWDVHFDTSAKLESLWLAIREKGFMLVETIHRMPDGRLKPTEVSANYLEHGSHRYIAGYFRDISLRKQEQAQLLAAKLQAEKANRAKSEFLSRMSHELRTPLNAVIGFGQLLEMGVPELPAPGQLEMLERIRLSGRHLLALIDDVLDLACIETGHLAVDCLGVSVDEAIESARSLLFPVAAASSIHITTPHVAGYQVWADPVRLRQVLVNLLSNAVKYSPPGGQVTLILANSETYLRLEVHDQGPGIPPEKHDLVFQPFERLGFNNTTIEGTGIGLAITRALVEAMRGRIGFDSEPGRGTVFWIELPSCHAKDQRNTVPVIIEVRQQTRWNAACGTVLYVEDNLANISLMQCAFRRLPGVQLNIMEDVGSLIAVMETEPCPNLILMDVNLPGMSGIEALQRIKVDTGWKNVPVIAVSALVMPGDLREIREAGFDACLVKPFDMVQLLDTIADACPASQGMV